MTKHTNRLIGFFDVLGFSRRLKTMPLDELHSKYAQLIDDVNRTIFNKKATISRQEDNFQTAQFVYDSLILISRPSEEVGNVSNFLFACCQLMEKCFVEQLPLRGAIGIGDVVEDPGRGISLSQVFPDLVNAEKRQEWTGAHVLPQAVEAILEILLGQQYSQYAPNPAYPLVPRATPFKSDGKIEYLDRWCLNWPHLLSKSELRKGMAFLDGAKAEETERFIEFIFGLPNREQLLSEDYWPAVTVRHLVTRSGFLPRFFDAAGEHEPLNGREIPWVAYAEPGPNYALERPR